MTATNLRIPLAMSRRLFQSPNPSSRLLRTHLRSKPICRRTRLRTRTSVTNGLWRMLKELMLDFQSLRQKMMAEHKEMVEWRYFAVVGEYPGFLLRCRNSAPDRGSSRTHLHLLRPQQQKSESSPIFPAETERRATRGGGRARQKQRDVFLVFVSSVQDQCHRRKPLQAGVAGEDEDGAPLFLCIASHCRTHLRSSSTWLMVERGRLCSCTSPAITEPISAAIVVETGGHRTSSTTAPLFVKILPALDHR